MCPTTLESLCGCSTGGHQALSANNPGGHAMHCPGKSPGSMRASKIAISEVNVIASLVLCGVCAAYTCLPLPTLLWLCFWNLGLGDASLFLFVVTLQLLSGGTSESGAPNNQPICECDDRCPSGVAALPHCSTASNRSHNMQCQCVAALL